MTSPITPGPGRRVLSIDRPDDVQSGLHPLGAPSADLMDRARVGWEHFTASRGEQPHV
ncbi:hypothetical protein ACFWA6_13820 [Streptomyces sp. NPDC060020]|uniref:hypothetical protein n=1 Tax=Streptomyces sp. NPDC060020 TaxID=3347038 RepID=UPI0036A131FD